MNMGQAAIFPIVVYARFPSIVIVRLVRAIQGVPHHRMGVGKSSFRWRDWF